jgi:glyoxylase-like metal-dependent hydrolase (beta-lactamase superfamily II)
MELLPSLHWIQGRASNIYLWTGDQGLMLVDTGMPGDAKNIDRYLGKIGREVSDIEAILITHADYDHAGSAAIVQARSGASVYAGSESAELLSQGKSPKHMPSAVQFVLDRFLGYRSVPAEAIKIVSDGEQMEELGDWRAIATPGHSPDHHSFASESQGILFAGDALNTRGGRLQNSQKRITADPEAARESAMRLLRLHPAVIACGHGKPIHSHNAADLMVLQRELQAQASDYRVMEVDP